jgi:hypothetical protein
MNNSLSILTPVFVLISACIGTISGNLLYQIYPSNNSHSELIAAILGALIGSITGGAVNFLLSYYDTKSKLLFEKAKLYDELKFSWIDLLSIYSNVIDKENLWMGDYKKDALHRMWQGTQDTIAAQDKCGRLLSNQMGLITHYLNNVSAKLYDAYHQDPLPKKEIYELISQIEPAGKKMYELVELECNLSKAILEYNFFTYCLFIFFPNTPLKNWEKQNTKYIQDIIRYMNTQFPNTTSPQNTPRRGDAG